MSKKSSFKTARKNYLTKENVFINKSKVHIKTRPFVNRLRFRFPKGGSKWVLM